MPRVNLSGMNVEALMDLRNQVVRRLLDCRAEIEKQLERMDGRQRDQEPLGNW